MARNEFMSKLKKATRFLSVLEVVTCILTNLLSNILKVKLKKLREETYLPDFRIKLQFKTLLSTNRQEAKKSVQSDHLEKQVAHLAENLLRHSNQVQENKIKNKIREIFIYYLGF